MQYVFRDDLYHLDFGDSEKIVGKEVAVCFDISTGTVHKHGARPAVEDWCRNARQKYVKANLQADADALVVIAGQIPLEEINKIIGQTGYILRFCGLGIKNE